MRLAGRVGAADVVEHVGLELEAGERAHARELGGRVAHEILVAELEVPVGTDAPAERLRSLDLGPPEPGEAGGVLRMAPPLRHDPAGHGEERERRVAAVPDEVHEARVGKGALEQRQVLHVERRLVAPPFLALQPGVGGEDRPDRLPRRHPRPQPLGHGARRQPPLAQRRQAPHVVEERVDVDRCAGVAVRQLGDEVRLVRNRDRRVAIEHHPQQRRARATDAEHEERLLGHRTRPRDSSSAITWPADASARSCSVSSRRSGATGSS